MSDLPRPRRPVGRVGGAPVHGDETVGDEPPLAHRHQSVAVAAHVVEPDLGEDGEVAGDRCLRRRYGLESDVGDVVAHDPPRPVVVHGAGSLAHPRRLGRPAEAIHDGRPALQRRGAADLEDAVFAEGTGELLEQIPIAGVGVLGQGVPAGLAGGELPEFHGPELAASTNYRTVGGSGRRVRKTSCPSPSASALIERFKKMLPSSLSCPAGTSRVAHIVRREACTAAGGWLAIVAATPRATGRRSPGATTCVTMPIISAFCAEMRSWEPISVIRMRSPNGMREAIRLGSKTAGMP